MSTSLPLLRLGQVARRAGDVGGVAEPLFDQRAVAESLSGGHPHRLGNAGPADAGVEHAVARGRIQEEKAQEVVAQ